MEKQVLSEFFNGQHSFAPPFGPSWRVGDVPIKNNLDEFIRKEILEKKMGLNKNKSKKHSKSGYKSDFASTGIGYFKAIDMTNLWMNQKPQRKAIGRDPQRLAGGGDGDGGGGGRP